MGGRVSIWAVRDYIYTHFWIGSTGLLVLLSAIGVDEWVRLLRNSNVLAIFILLGAIPIGIFVVLYVILAIQKTRSITPLWLAIGGAGVTVLSLTLFPALSDEEQHFLTYQTEYENVVVRARSGESLRGLCPGRESVEGCVWQLDRGANELFLAFEPLDISTGRQVVYVEEQSYRYCPYYDMLRRVLLAPNWYVCTPDWP